MPPVTPSARGEPNGRTGRSQERQHQSNAGWISVEQFTSAMGRIEDLVMGQRTDLDHMAGQIEDLQQGMQACRRFMAEARPASAAKPGLGGEYGKLLMAKIDKALVQSAKFDGVEMRLHALDDQCCGMEKELQHALGRLESHEDAIETIRKPLVAPSTPTRPLESRRIQPPTPTRPLESRHSQLPTPVDRTPSVGDQARARQYTPARTVPVEPPPARTVSVEPPPPSPLHPPKRPTPSTSEEFPEDPFEPRHSPSKRVRLADTEVDREPPQDVPRREDSTPMHLVAQAEIPGRAQAESRPPGPDPTYPEFSDEDGPIAPDPTYPSFADIEQGLDDSSDRTYQPGPSRRQGSGSARDSGGRPPSRPKGSGRRVKPPAKYDPGLGHGGPTVPHSASPRARDLFDHGFGGQTHPQTGDANSTAIEVPRYNEHGQRLRKNGEIDKRSFRKKERVAERAAERQAEAYQAAYSQAQREKEAAGNVRPPDATTRPPMTPRRSDGVPAPNMVPPGAGWQAHDDQTRRDTDRAVREAFTRESASDV
ncbi:MAG: hypothetical protein M1832_001304 [Thelocarpon impressellum]|nr:MAG: hypothetical protein M1832_001304 [Thelocarpon impressellum]